MCDIMPLLFGLRCGQRVRLQTPHSNRKQAKSASEYPEKVQFLSRPNIVN
jgi:hypothetical protein